MVVWCLWADVREIMFSFAIRMSSFLIHHKSMTNYNFYLRLLLSGDFRALAHLWFLIQDKSYYLRRLEEYQRSRPTASPRFC